jgi:hypothetical protein
MIFNEIHFDTNFDVDKRPDLFQSIYYQISIRFLIENICNRVSIFKI